eukprot:2741406-Rhodomonas_salina.1
MESHRTQRLLPPYALSVLHKRVSQHPHTQSQYCTRAYPNPLSTAHARVPTPPYAISVPHTRVSEP